jgi:uncharacterized protein YjbI with pentapeptide repeats
MPILKSAKKSKKSHFRKSFYKITYRFGQFLNFSKLSHPISDNAIRQRAFELWKARGGHGSDIDNWNEAKHQLEQEQFQQIKGLQKVAFLANQPLIFVEKRFLEPCADWFERAAIFKIIEKTSPIIEAIGVILIPFAIWWFTETSEEVKDRQEKAVRGQQAVQIYLNQLSNILLQGGVDKLEKNEQLKIIMRASTLALFENPDLQNDLEEDPNSSKDRKGQVIRYLSETGLIESSNTKDGTLKLPIISLKEAQLKGANLARANLQRANLQGAYLLWAYLSLANLERANLQEADLRRANLDNTNLRLANLQEAFMILANLQGANLERANLQEAYLQSANLESANLEEANLQGANLQGANLQGANLQGANLQGAKYTDENTNMEYCFIIAFAESPCPTKFPSGFDPKTSRMVSVKSLKTSNP